MLSYNECGWRPSLINSFVLLQFVHISIKTCRRWPSEEEDLRDTSIVHKVEDLAPWWGPQRRRTSEQLDTVQTTVSMMHYNLNVLIYYEYTAHNLSTKNAAFISIKFQSKLFSLRFFFFIYLTLFCISVTKVSAK